MALERHKARFYVGDKGRVITDFNAPQADETGFSEDHVRLEYWMAKQIGTKLMSTYPGRQWHIDCDCRNKVVIISCPSVSKTRGYRLHMKGDNMAQLLPRCVKAAGEILERHNVTRGRIIDPVTLDSFERDVNDNVKSPDATSFVEKWNTP